MTETVLMIHGMWASGALWEKWANYFEDRGFHCLRTTLRHHGGDPAAPPHPELGTTSLLDYAQDLEEEIRRLEAPPIIIGHSMGGLLAQMLGARGLARMLVLLTPASPRGIMAIKPSVLRSFWSGMTTWAFWRKALRQTYGEAVYSMMHLLTPEEQREIYLSFGFESGRAAAEIGFWLFDPRRASQVNGESHHLPNTGGGGGGRPYLSGVGGAPGGEKVPPRCDLPGIPRPRPLGGGRAGLGRHRRLLRRLAQGAPAGGTGRQRGVRGPGGKSSGQKGR